ncbi:ABC transporter substrate-binding protein [Roseomonas sp. OT10]|uniref:ABC transporter substrate-binding protein n=1 Tax=Roseomonas cutis TaxID=2897332 RepID=UPI001E4D1949|nr:ABC transporter substrate-binding protein [Roseomonas sp. OT10]UFN46811.1 ABC transporter substrate-binding protein [Roseomonas sp. OT10]
MHPGFAGACRMVLSGEAGIRRIQHVARRPLLGGFALLSALRAVPGAAPAVLAQVPAPPAQGGDGRNELRLGALFPFTGPLALLGDESFRGLEMAVDECNGAGGLLTRPVRLVKADVGDASRAVAEARRLTGSEKVVAVLGTSASALASAASQVVDGQGLPYFELDSIADPITERGLRGLFRACPRASDFARVSVEAVEMLADAWARALAPADGPVARMVPRVAILFEDGLYGQSVSGFQEARLRERGMPPVEKLSYPSRPDGLAAFVQRLRGVEAEVVLHSGYPGEVVLLYRAMREVAWRPRMVIGAGAGYSLSDTARAVGADFEGTLNVDFTPFAVNDAAAPGARPFAEAYKRRYGAEPRSGHSLSSYVGTQAFLEAVQRAGSVERDRVRAAMLALDLPEGTLANGWGARFDEAGQNTRARPYLMQWQGGRQVTVAPPLAAVAELRDRMG